MKQSTTTIHLALLNTSDEYMAASRAVDDARHSGSINAVIAASHLFAVAMNKVIQEHPIKDAYK